MLAQKSKILYAIAAGQPDDAAPVINELKRPLSRCGIAEVLNFLEDLKEHPIQPPELILCSPSLYVLQTLDLLQEIFGNIDVVVKDALYAAPDYRILDTVKSLDDIFSCAMILGELPGLKEFIGYVSKGTKNHFLRPASGIKLILEPNESWHTFGPQKACRQPLIKD